MAKRRKKKPEGGNVVDIRKKQLDKITERINTAVSAGVRSMREASELIVEDYRRWERENPELALEPFEKMQMVLLGFVGPGGFERCHEPGRRPEASFISEQLGVSEEIRSDRNASDILMCPAMESRKCQGIWAGQRLPPCQILLLEVYLGLGGDAYDDKVQDLLADFDNWEAPEGFAQSFERGERLLREHEEAAAARARADEGRDD